MAMRRLLLLIAVALLASSCYIVHQDELRWLHVDDDGRGSIVDGEPVRGVNRSSFEYACIQGWGHSEGFLEAEGPLSWNANTVRIALNERCWLEENPPYMGGSYRDAVEAQVDELVDSGMTVILDLHWSGNATGQENMAGAASVEFWRQVAGVFSANDDNRYVNVWFDLFNEPHDISDDCWLNGCGDYVGMADLYDAVRSQADNIVVVTANGWGNNLSGYQIPDDWYQVVAGVHIYDFTGCSTLDCWQNEILRVHETIAPVVITEFGDTDCGGAWSGTLLTWAKTYGIGTVAWTWNTWSGCGGPHLVSDLAGTPAHDYGRTVRDHYLGVD